MSITLPSDLVWALNLLGFNWPEADEDRLRESAQHWRDFSAEVGNVLNDSNRVVAQIVSENRGPSIDAFHHYWRGIGGGGGHLAEAQEAAELAAAALEAFAVVVEGLKAAVIAQLITFVTEFLATQAAAVETAGVAEGAAAAEVIATRSILRALLDDGIKQVTREVLQQLRTRAREMFLQMLNRARVTGLVSAGLDFAKQEYEINVLHTRQGLSVTEVGAAGVLGGAAGAGSSLIHMRLEPKPETPPNAVEPAFYRLNLRNVLGDSFEQPFLEKLGREINDQFTSDQWAAASPDQREAMLEKAHRTILERSGLPPDRIGLRFENLDVDLSGRSTAREAVLNRSILQSDDPAEAIKTLAHEDRHVFQRWAILGRISAPADYVQKLKDSMPSYPIRKNYRQYEDFLNALRIHPIERDACGAEYHVYEGYRNGDASR